MIVPQNLNSVGPPKVTPTVWPAHPPMILSFNTSLESLYVPLEGAVIFFSWHHAVAESSNNKHRVDRLVIVRLLIHVDTVPKIGRPCVSRIGQLRDWQTERLHPAMNLRQGPR